jgi:hypothetical protein
MRLWQRYLNIISVIVPAGAVGASVLLGATVPGSASERPAGALPAASDAPPVSERLAAIREATFAVVEPQSGARQPDGNFHLAWGNRWGNGGWGPPGPGWGWGRPSWNNWRNFRPRWNNWWRNW